MLTILLNKLKLINEGKLTLDDVIVGFFVPEDIEDFVFIEPSDDKNKILAYVDDLIKLQDKVTNIEDKYGYSDVRARDARSKIVEQLIKVKFSSLFLYEVFEDLRKYIDDIHHDENIIIDLIIKNENINKSLFIKGFIDNESNFVWFSDMYVRYPEYQKYFDDVKNKVLRAQQCLKFDENNIAMNVQTVKNIYIKAMDADARSRASKKEMINLNLKTVISIAKKYSNSGFTLLDLIQEGNIGLMKAIDRFDYRHGFQMSSYFTWWIRHEIIRTIDEKKLTRSIPFHMIETLNEIKVIQKQLLEQMEHDGLL
jgi:RNA polymerase primary sigma factor